MSSDYPGSLSVGAKIGITVFVILVVLAVPIGWAIHVATSGVQGRGDQIIKNNSETNRSGKQELFEQLYADVEAYKVQISTGKAAVKANPDPTDAARLNSILTGTINQCVKVTNDYNAETHKVLSQDWKDSRLPYELTASACTEAAK